MENKKKKIFIYDVSRAFARFMLQYFGDAYFIQVCSKDSDILNFDLRQFNIAFFILTEDKDVINFIPIKANIRHIFVGSNKSDTNKIFEIMEDVVFINVQDTKKNILEKIQYNLKLFNLSEHYEI